MTSNAAKNDLVLKKIKELPPVPLVVHKLIRIMEDDNSNAEDVTEVLSSDQALASKVLKLVNSSFYGLSGEVSTISRAVVILGFAAIRNLATGLGVAGAIANVGRGGLMEDFWEHAITVGGAAEIIARKSGYGDPEEAFIAGLLHDIGHLILAKALPQEYKQYLQLDTGDPLENEQQILGMAHTKAGQKLLKHWKLPGPLSNATRFHHHPQVAVSGEDKLVSIVAMADAFARIHGASSERPPDPAWFAELTGAVGLDFSQTDELLAGIQAKVEETRQFLKIAADLDTPDAQPEKTANLRVVLICTNPSTAGFATCILRHGGHSLIPMAEFFNGTPADLVIIDPGSISPQQMQKIKPAIQKAREISVVFGIGGDPVQVPDLGLSLSSIPLNFSQADLMFHKVQAQIQS